VLLDASERGTKKINSKGAYCSIKASERGPKRSTPKVLIVLIKAFEKGPKISTPKVLLDASEKGTQKINSKGAYCSY
jgi:hypothetical protein